MLAKLLRLMSFMLFFCLVWQCNIAQAALHIELTQGNKQAIPLGIAAIANDPVDPGSQQSLQAIISHDLHNSGEVAVTTAAQARTLAEWRQQKVEYLLRVTVTTLGGHYQVRAQLFNVYGNAGQETALLDQSFKASAASLRAVAHRLSDLVYQQLTGVRGLFSTRVAYVSVQHQATGAVRYQLVVADADGYNPRTLLTSPQPIMSPAWSPDGKQLVYVSFEGHRAAIYQQHLSSGQRTLLSRFAGINGAPAFSPDGRQLALVLSYTGHPKLYLMNLADKKLTQLTDGYAIDTEPSWSPDGRALVFTSNRGGSPQIYRFELGSKAIERLTYQGNYNARATYTPDGGGLVLMHRDKHGFTIAYQNLATGQLRGLTRAGNDESPSLAPNGKMVVYATGGQHSQLAVVSTDSRVALRLPAQQGDVQEPAWSPFLT